MKIKLSLKRKVVNLNWNENKIEKRIKNETDLILRVKNYDPEVHNVYDQ